MCVCVSALDNRAFHRLLRVFHLFEYFAALSIFRAAGLGVCVCERFFLFVLSSSVLKSISLFLAVGCVRMEKRSEMNEVGIG